MAVHGDLPERVIDASRDARRVAALDADAVGDGVCRLETDATDFGRQTIGVVFEHINREGTVLFENTRGERARKAVVFEPEHEVAELGLLLIRRCRRLPGDGPASAR